MAEGRRWAKVVAEGEGRREIVEQEATAALALAAFVAAGVLWLLYGLGLSSLKCSVTPCPAFISLTSALGNLVSSPLIFESG